MDDKTKSDSEKSDDKVQKKAGSGVKTSKTDVTTVATLKPKDKSDISPKKQRLVVLVCPTFKMKCFLVQFY